ncbi:helix-turn-helix domain-containing protein [Chryseobacterium sp. 22532]|uniref:helix-turn-helix domain-containing protein n=1 Tax=Chryseobacterium sp. 22532 TaxID=3453938 RepID=UPI003F845687
MEKNLTPNYKLIFLDILEQKFPDRKDACMPILSKNELSQFDIIELNQKIFGGIDKDTFTLNQKHKAYNKHSISKILNYQIKNDLSNMRTASIFRLSRNTITKWKKKYTHLISVTESCN